MRGVRTEGFPRVCKTRIGILRDSPLKSVQILPKQSNCKRIPTERDCVPTNSRGVASEGKVHARTKTKCMRRFCVCDSEERRSNTCTWLHNRSAQTWWLKATTTDYHSSVGWKPGTAAFSAQGDALANWGLGSSSPFIPGTGIIQFLAVVRSGSPFPSTWPALLTTWQLGLPGQQKGTC